jgi:hypothetical protein
MNMPCPCGAGTCLILIAKAGNNAGKQFYRCPGKQVKLCVFLSMLCLLLACPTLAEFMCPLFGATLVHDKAEGLHCPFLLNMSLQDISNNNNNKTV